MKSGIYLITNLIDGKNYVGAALNVKNRFGQHQYCLRHNKHGNKYLQNAWNKYSEKAFEFKVLQHIEDITILIDFENKWIKLLNSLSPNGYNIRLDANNNIGIKHSDQSKRNMSEAHKGKVQSEESKRKKSESLKSRKFSQESLEKMSIAQIGISVLKRRYDKWPCIEGIKCRCADWVKKKSAYSLDWYHKNKLKQQLTSLR